MRSRRTPPTQPAFRRRKHFHPPTLAAFLAATWHGHPGGAGPLVAEWRQMRSFFKALPAPKAPHMAVGELEEDYEKLLEIAAL